MTTGELNPVRLLHHKSQDLSLETEASRILWSAMTYLDGVEKEELVGRWIEGRL